MHMHTHTHIHTHTHTHTPHTHHTHTHTHTQTHTHTHWQEEGFASYAASAATGIKRPSIEGKRPTTQAKETYYRSKRDLQ
jgi:hypothetical protein